VRIRDPKQKANFAREVTRHHFPVPGSSPDSSVLTGDRARERGAENRSDAPIHLIKRSQELKAGKYALFSLSPFIFVAKKEKTGKIGGKERERRKRKEVYPASDSRHRTREKINTRGEI